MQKTDNEGVRGFLIRDQEGLFCEFDVQDVSIVVVAAVLSASNERSNCSIPFVSTRQFPVTQSGGSGVRLASSDGAGTSAAYVEPRYQVP